MTFMTIYDYPKTILRQFMTIHDYLWLFMAIYDYYMTIYDILNFY